MKAKKSRWESACKGMNNILNIHLIGFIYHPRLTTEKVVRLKNTLIRMGRNGLQ